MATVNEEFLLGLLDAMGDPALGPLYPALYAKERELDRDWLDRGLDDLRRRGLVRFTDWVKDRGQGYELTDAGRQALATRKLTRAAAPTPAAEEREIGGAYERGEIVRRPFLVRPAGRVSRVLLILNLLYFAFGATLAAHWGDLPGYLVGRNSVVANRVNLELGALYPPLVLPHPDLADARSEHERLVLSCFIHVGLLHLFMNMYFLTTIGPLVEAMWGWPRFLAIYAVSGLMGGLAIMLIVGYTRPPLEEIRYSAGASGCLFGIFTAMVVWFSLNYQHLPEGVYQAWQRSMSINMILLIAINFVPSVSWQGHFGGAVGGLLTALVLHAQRFHPSPPIRWLAMVCVPAIPAAFFLAMLWQAGRL